MNSMRAFGRSNSAKAWARLAMKAGLLATDAKFLSDLNEQLHEHAQDVGDVILRKTRVQSRGKRDWSTYLTSLLAGIGIGMTVGMLIAPSSGEEMRAAMRARVTGVKDSVSDMAARATRPRSASEVR